jgi:hypothetical protein
MTKGKANDDPPGASLQGLTELWAAIERRADMTAFDVRDGTADPKDARRLLELFCEYVERDQRPPDVLMQHMRDSLRRFLSGECKRLDQAFGLSGRPGAHSIDIQVKFDMTAEVVRLRVEEGMSHQEALSEVEDQFHHGHTAIGEAFREHLQEGIAKMMIARQQRGQSLTAEERERLANILNDADDKWKRRGSAPGDPDRLHPEHRPRSAKADE